jgi:heterodisulfide reductase subunit B
MKLSYYPGCSLEGTALDYDHSVREVCLSLGIELVEIPDWNCCGASSAHMTDHEIGMRLPMRNLILAQDLGNDILVPCAACFQRLKAADKALRENAPLWDVPEYSPTFEIIHISTLLARADMQSIISDKVISELSGLKIACYYGCLSLRNPQITGAPQWETPVTLERIMEGIGADPVRWSHRTECCSGSLTMARPDIAGKLVGDIATAAMRAGATALVTDCPMCQANMETRQQAREEGESRLPVFFATELIVAALSGSYSLKQQKKHLVSPDILTDIMQDRAADREEVI